MTIQYTPTTITLFRPNIFIYNTILSPFSKTPLYFSLSLSKHNIFTMGNCTSNKYAAETMPMSDEDEEAVEMVRRRLVADDGARKCLASTTTELKIRITKRDLEKLLRKVDVEELPVTELLSELIDIGDAFESTHRRSWQPSLQSIPEVN